MSAPVCTPTLRANTSRGVPRKPLPPHARELAEARERGLTLRHGYVAVSFGWRRPVNGYGVTLPDDRDPGAFDWSWARGLDVLLWRRGDPVQRVLAAVSAIRAASPRRIVVVDVLDSGRCGRIFNVLMASRRFA